MFTIISLYTVKCVIINIDKNLTKIIPGRMLSNSTVKNGHVT